MAHLESCCSAADSDPILASIFMCIYMLRMHENADVVERVAIYSGCACEN